MSILETFYILFKGDSTDVKKSAKESEKAVKDLETTVKSSFQKVDHSTRQVNQSFYELAKAATTFIAASVSAYTVFHRVIEASNYAGELGNISKALGVNVGTLDAWGQAVQRTGGSAAGFQNSLRNLSQHFGTSAATTLKFLPKLADAFARLGNFRAQYYGKLLGLDEATILLLQQGRREVESVIAKQKELGVVTEKDVEISNKYTLANLQLSLAFRSLYLTLAQEILPATTAFYNTLVPIIEYIKRHKDFVIGAFIGIGIAAVAMLAPFVIAHAAIIGTGIAIAALIGLFAVAYEDIKAYIQGNSSLTGDLIKRWTDVKNIFDDVFTSLSKIFSFSSVPGLSAAIDLARSAIGQANINAPGLTSGASNFFNRSYERNSDVNMGGVVINTQATDANGIAKDFTRELLTKHLWQANNDVADGVAY